MGHQNGNLVNLIGREDSVFGRYEEGAWPPEGGFETRPHKIHPRTCVQLFEIMDGSNRSVL